MFNLIKKEDLFEMFFNISGNEQMDKLNSCKCQCELFLSKNKDENICDLVSVINALMVYFETGSKEEARKYVIDLWCKLYPKDKFTFFEIRILNAMLVTELNVEKIIEIVEDCLIQLENYKFDDGYLKTRISMNLNLLDSLMKSKFFDTNYKVEYDDLMFQLTKEIIRLNLQTRLNSNYYVGLANTYQGILLKDESLIYTGLLLLRSSHKQNSKSIEDFIKVYTKNYNISV